MNTEYSFTYGHTLGVIKLCWAALVDNDIDHFEINLLSSTFPHQLRNFSSIKGVFVFIV